VEMPAGLESYRPSLKGDGKELLLFLPAEESAGKLLQVVCSVGLKVKDFETDQSGLEEVFIQLTGMKGRPGSEQER